MYFTYLLFAYLRCSKTSNLCFVKGLKVTMKKHPSCYRLDEPLKSVNAQVKSEAVVIYDGRFYNQGLSAEHAQVPDTKFVGKICCDIPTLYIWWKRHLKFLTVSAAIKNY